MIPFPDKRYSILYCDPPWSYRVWSKKGAGRTASAHYNVLSTKEICEHPIPDICLKDCALFLWATYPNLLDAVRVLQAWGFTYKTVAFTWVKLTRRGKPYHLGLGHWTRANPELVLLGTKGHPKRINRSVRNLIVAPVREHSRKPDEVREGIVALVGDLPRIELFARQQEKGWDAWGDEVKPERTDKLALTS